MDSFIARPSCTSFSSSAISSCLGEESGTLDTFQTMSIHARIRARREALGLSQARLGELVGVGYQAVQQWEREPVPGDTSVQSTAPKRTRLAKVAEALQCSEEWLLTGHAPSGDLDPTEAAFLDMFRKLPARVQAAQYEQVASIYNALNPDKPHRADPYPGKLPND